jgi:hypothetical protein
VKSFYATLRRCAFAVLPRNRLGDYVAGLLDFFRVHKRLPKKNSWLLNDYLFYLKNSPEINDPARFFVTDKEFVKIFVSGIVGNEFNVPTLAVLRTTRDVDDFVFPESCCVKPSHASGLVLLREKGEPLDRAIIKSWLFLNYYDKNREVNYRFLQPKVIVEPLLFGDANILDFKIFCFEGSPRMIQVDFDRRANHSRNFFSIDWVELNFAAVYPRNPRTIQKPSRLDDMLKCARLLSARFGLVRVDFYSNESEFYVGEITNVSENALFRISPQSAEESVSKLIFQGVLDEDLKKPEFLS